MTLTDLIPSLRGSLPPRLPAEIWPRTTRRAGPEVYVGGVALSAVAERYGTPVYLIDEDEVRCRCREFREAFGAASVVYAGRALACRGVFRWIREEGLSLGVATAGELAVARGVDFPAERIVLCGDARTPGDLRAACEYRVGRVVVASPSEIAPLAAAAGSGQHVQLRVLFGAEAPESPARERFGLQVDGDDFAEAVRGLAEARLVLAGLDFYLGPQISTFGGYEAALRRLVAVLARLTREYGLAPTELNLGGGFAAPHRQGQAAFSVAAFALRVRGALRVECERHGVAPPRLSVQPGRALVARAGVALYRVLTVRRSAGGRQLVGVDGGVSDNPRPVRYGERYTPALVGRVSRAAPCPSTVVGRHGEPGDVVVRDLALPGDVHPGDLLAVPACGAYHHAMASNYALLPRPPLIAVRAGQPRPLVRADTTGDVLARDLG